jgi:hypothetical protein
MLIVNKSALTALFTKIKQKIEAKMFFLLITFYF